jgi:ketosteroid isomerase-like protein
MLETYAQSNRRKQEVVAMGANGNGETFERWIAAHRAHDIDTMLTLVTDDVTIESAAGSAMPSAAGKEQARRHWQTIYGTFPDMRMEAVDLTTDGDTVFAEISHGGTMEGPMGDKRRRARPTTSPAPSGSISRRRRSATSGRTGTPLPWAGSWD